MDIAIKIIYENTLNNKIINEHDVFTILEKSCDELKLNSLVTKNYFVRESDFISKFTKSNKTIMFNYNNMRNYAVLKANTINFPSNENKLFYINVMMLYLVLFRLYYAEDMKANIEVFFFSNKAEDRLKSEGIYTDDIKKCNPSFRYAKHEGLSKIKCLLEELEESFVLDIVMHDIYKTLEYGYYVDDTYFPINKYYSLADEAIPESPDVIDKMILGYLVDESRV